MLQYWSYSQTLLIWKTRSWMESTVKKILQIFDYLLGRNTAKEERQKHILLEEDTLRITHSKQAPKKTAKHQSRNSVPASNDACPAFNQRMTFNKCPICNTRNHQTKKKRHLKTSSQLKVQQCCRQKLSKQKPSAAAPVRRSNSACLDCFSQARTSVANCELFLRSPRFKESSGESYPLARIDVQCQRTRTYDVDDDGDEMRSSPFSSVVRELTDKKFKSRIPVPRQDPSNPTKPWRRYVSRNKQMFVICAIVCWYLFIYVFWTVSSF